MNDLTAFKELFDIYNAYSDNELHVEQIQEMYSTIRIGGISQAQVGLFFRTCSFCLF